MKNYIIMLFLVWNLLLFIVYLPASQLIPLKKQFSYNDGPGTIKNPSFLWHRANFDGIHYLKIAQKSYSINQQAFFPLYPRLIRNLSSLLGGHYLIAGIAISYLSTLVALILLYRLVIIDYSIKVAQRTLLLWLLFPTSFFLGSVYTEGFFMALVLGSFYSARIGKWWLAGLLGMLAANTRIIGVLVFPALLYEFYSQRTLYCQIGNFGTNFKTKLGTIIRKAYCLLQPVTGYLPLFLIPLGLFVYMHYLLINYNDPFMFLRIQPAFSPVRADGQIILLYQVFWRYLKMVLTTRLDMLYIVVWIELLTSLGIIGLIVYSLKQKIRTSYLIYAITAFIVPTLTGIFSSIPRYALGLFPLFIGLGLIENKTLRWITNIVFCLLFIICYAMFAQGYWIA